MADDKTQPVAGLERRYYPLSQVQVERRSGAPSKISGHSAVFNSASDDLGFFTELIRPGAFRNSLKRDQVVALFNHDPNFPLGSTYDGRLNLREDDKGLYMEVHPTDTSYSRDLMTNIAEGLIRSQSFGFMVAEGGDEWRVEDGKHVRELTEVRLFDVSPVTFPAYPTTDVQVRQLCKQTDVDFEGLSAAMVRQFRGLELSRADQDILRRAAARLPILRGSAGQAPPAPETKAETPQAWRLQLHRRRWALAAKSKRAMSDPDDDAGALAQAVDQSLDEAQKEHAAGNDDQAWQLVTAAETTVDQLLEVLNVTDSDEANTA